MTSLTARGLHRLIPRMARAGVTSRKGLVGVNMVAPVVLRGDLVRMVVGGQRWYSGQIPAVQVDTKEEETPEWEKKTVKSHQEEKMDRMLYKMDMDVRRQGRTVSFELEKIVRMVEKNGVCTANQALLVLRCCGEVLVDLDMKERTKLVESYTKILKQNGVEFDVSHYNALLRVHIENQNIVAASDFLAEMESAGISPNRVTFQHLVGVYCMEGNIAGATTILEHMKAQDMAINEAVFISLLKGHCANNDSDSASATLEVMANSGLSLGADTYTAMACSYGRAGNWDKVEEMLGKAGEEDVKLDDGDIFSVILACSQGGLSREAEGLVAKLPKKRGFFQELRNHLPQLALSGNVQVAVEVYLSLDDKEGDGREGKGLFVVGSIARSGESVEVILEAIKRMEDAGFTSSIQFLVQEAAQSWSKEKCEHLAEILKKEREGQPLELDSRQLFMSLRNSLQLNRDAEQSMACLNNLHSMGVEVPWTFLSSDLIPAMINLELDTPGATAKKLKDTCTSIPWNVVSNLMLVSLLNGESAEHLSAATGFLLHVNIGHVRPDRWNASLARSFLQTGRLEDLITIMFISSRKSILGQRPEETVMRLFRVLEHIVSLSDKYQPESTVDQVITPVLEELVRLHIGVPSLVVDKLREEVQSEEARDLLDKAVKEWDNREEFWTEKEEAACLAERKSLYKEKAKIPKGTNQRFQSEYRGFITVPEGREQMEEIQSVLARRGEVNLPLSDKLILAYSEEGMLDEAFQLLRYSQEKGNFSNSPTNLEAIVIGLVGQGRAKEALQLVEDQLEKGDRIFISSMMNALAGLAQVGENQAVLDKLGMIDRSRFIKTRGSNANILLNVYSSKGDAEKVEEVFNALLANNLASTDQVNNLSPLVEVHLVKGDVTAAVAELERIARMFKKMPKKFDVTCRLIEEENVEAMQSILDTSIELFGEENSLYDLAYCFIHMNRRAQAKKLLETPGLSYQKDKIEYICTQLRESGNLNGLEDLVNLSKSIFGCDRDFLYHQLVSAFNEDVDKVEDIWLQVQEEGHAPSDSLKIAIAKVFKHGGRNVPFEEPVEYLEVERNIANTTNKPEVQKAKSTTQTTKSTTQKSKSTTQKTKSTPQKKVKGDDVAKAALANNDMAGLVDTIVTGDTSLNCRNEILSEMVSNDRLDDASKVALAMCSRFTGSKLPPKIINPICEMMKKFEETGQVQKTIEFVNQLSPKMGLALRGSIWVKVGLIRTDPTAYIELLKSDTENPKTWVVNSDVLLEAVEKQPDLRSRLEVLAAENFSPANVLLSKLSLAQGNAENLEKHLKHLSTDLLKMRYVVFDKVDTIEKMEMAFEALNKNGLDKEVFDQVANNCLTINVNSDRFVDIANLAVDRGMELESFAKSILKRLQENTDFKLHSEAQKLSTTSSL